MLTHAPTNQNFYAFGSIDAASKEFIYIFPCISLRDTYIREYKGLVAINGTQAARKVLEGYKAIGINNMERTTTLTNALEQSLKDFS